MKKDLVDAITHGKSQEEIGRLKKKLEKFRRKVRAAFYYSWGTAKLMMPVGFHRTFLSNVSLSKKSFTLGNTDSVGSYAS